MDFRKITGYWYRGRREREKIRRQRARQRVTVIVKRGREPRFRLGLGDGDRDLVQEADPRRTWSLVDTWMVRDGSSLGRCLVSDKGDKRPGHI